MYLMKAVFRFQWPRVYSTLESSSENAYKILGLQRDCSAESVRAAFRQLAKATHPDKQQPSISGSASSAHFVRVLAAYQILADPRKRARYDAQLGAQEKLQQRKEDFYQRQNYQRKEPAWKRRRRRGFDRGVDPSETDAGFADPSASIHQPERQEFVCPETEVVEWLRYYRSSVTSAVHRRELGVGGGLLEGVRGELGSALRKAYHGPPVYEEKGIPDCFEADERREPHVGSDVLQLVSGHNLFGFVRVPQHPMLESLHSHIKAVDHRTGDDTSECSKDCSSHYDVGHTGRSRSIPGNEGVESEYVDLELHVFGKVIARASRVQPVVDDSCLNGSEPRGDRIYVYSVLPDAEDKRHCLESDSGLIGTIHGLGDMSPQIVCAAHGPDGKLTHRIVQYQSPLVKHMTWFKESGICECRCRRASLLPSRYWIFAPRSTTHNVGGWYIESWNSQVRYRKRQSVRNGDEHGMIELSGQENSRINPAMYIIAAAYKTLDEEAAKRRKFSKFIELGTMGDFIFDGQKVSTSKGSLSSYGGVLDGVARKSQPHWPHMSGMPRHYLHKLSAPEMAAKSGCFYHRKRYSGDADPRMQAGGSHNVDRGKAAAVPSEALRRPTSVLLQNRHRRSSPSHSPALVDVGTAVREKAFQHTLAPRLVKVSTPHKEKEVQPLV